MKNVRESANRWFGLIKSNFESKLKKAFEKNNRYETFYLLSIIFFILYWSIGFLFNKCDLTIAKYMCVIIGTVFLAVSAFTSKFNKKELIIWGVSLLFSIYIYLGTGKQYEGVLTIAPSIIAIKNISLNKAIKVMNVTLLVVFFVFIILNVLNLIPNDIGYKVDKFGRTYKMYLFGGQHGNTVYMYFFCILSTYIYINKQCFDIKKVISCLICTVVLYYFLRSRTGIILSTLLIIGAKTIEIKSIRDKVIANKYVKECIKFLVTNFHIIICVAILLLSTIFLNTHISKLLDNLVTNRISCTNVYITNFGLSLFPRNIIDSFVFDNMYSFMIVHYGIIFGLIYCLLYKETIKKLFKNRMYMEILFIGIYALYAYSEKGFLKVFCNFPMLFWAYLIYNNLFTYKNEVDKNENINCKNVSL